jgi:transcriptional regulator with XRE-family HTH domain
MDLRMGLAQALQMTRKSKGITQEDFSDVSSRTYVSSLERGLKSPTVEKMDELASVLGVHPVSLFLLTYMLADNADMPELLQRVTSEVTAVFSYKADA